MKYMGSKRRIAKYLLPIILKDRKPNQWYVEPFVGGCNMIDKVDGKRIGNDSNYYLIAMWKALQNGWVPPMVTKDKYRHIRNHKERYEEHFVGWVGQCSYSGGFFEGGFGGSDYTKNGIVKNYQDEMRRSVFNQIKKLQGVKFLNKNYLDLKLKSKCIIYCDPPYANTTKYKFDINHEEFWNWVRKMKEFGHSVFVSEYNAPDDFQCVWEKEIKSQLSINSIGGCNKISTEKLFV